MQPENQDPSNVYFSATRRQRLGLKNFFGQLLQPLSFTTCIALRWTYHDPETARRISTLHLPRLRILYSSGMPIRTWPRQLASFLHNHRGTLREVRLLGCSLKMAVLRQMADCPMTVKAIEVRSDASFWRADPDRFIPEPDLLSYVNDGLMPAALVQLLEQSDMGDDPAEIDPDVVPLEISTVEYEESLKTILPIIHLSKMTMILTHNTAGMTKSGLMSSCLVIDATKMVAMERRCGSRHHLHLRLPCRLVCTKRGVIYVERLGVEKLHITRECSPRRAHAKLQDAQPLGTLDR